MNTQELAELLNPCQADIITYLEEFQHLSDIQTRDYDPTSELQRYPPVISVPEVSPMLPPVNHPTSCLFMYYTPIIQVPSPILTPMFPPKHSMRKPPTPTFKFKPSLTLTPLPYSLSCIPH